MFMNPTCPVLRTVLGVTEESEYKIESSWGNGTRMLGTTGISK